MAFLINFEVINRVLTYQEGEAFFLFNYFIYTWEDSAFWVLNENRHGYNHLFPFTTYFNMVLYWINNFFVNIESNFFFGQTESKFKYIKNRSTMLGLLISGRDWVESSLNWALILLIQPRF